MLLSQISQQNQSMGNQSMGNMWFLYHFSDNFEKIVFSLIFCMITTVLKPMNNPFPLIMILLSQFSSKTVGCDKSIISMASTCVCGPWKNRGLKNGSTWTFNIF